MADQNTTVAQAWRQIFASLDTLALTHETVANAFAGDVSNVSETQAPNFQQHEHITVNLFKRQSFFSSPLHFPHYDFQ